MFLTTLVLCYVSDPVSFSATAGVESGFGADGDFGLDSCSSCSAEELALEVSFFFFLFPFPVFVDGLPLHAVADLDMPINLELRYEIGLVTSRKTPDIILPPIRVIGMEQALECATLGFFIRLDRSEVPRALRPHLL